VQVFSPGFETNDAGFMIRTDIISAHALVQYVNQTVTPHFREKDGWFGVYENRNFDGNSLERGAFANFFGVFSNYWQYGASLFVSPGAFSDRATRGGPLIRTPGGWSSDLNLGSDDRKSFFAAINSHLDHDREGSYNRNVSLSVTARPSSNLTVSLVPALSRLHDHTQYVTAFDDSTATATYGKRYLFADLEERTFELGTRVDWTLTSRLSFQLYLQPFIASGDFHDYHALAAARTRDYVPHAAAGPDPDFNFRSVRGSAVMRWEFRPGSALYVVWNENRATVAPIGDFRLGRDLRAISTAPSHDVFLVKFSYWLPM